MRTESARTLSAARLLAALAVLLGACVDRPEATAPIAVSPHNEIVDAVHNAGNAHFFFLPPMVPQPTTSGTADGSLTPEVSVCEWNGLSCVTTVAQFTTTAGTGSAVVGYAAGQQQHEVNWRTDQCAWGPCELDPARVYRLTVRVGSLELGHADLQVFANASQAKNLQTNEYIALVEGRTLPVRFRIEYGIVSSIEITPNPATVPIGQTLQMTATVRDLHGSVIPNASVSWAVGNATLAGVSTGGVVSGVAGGCTTVSAASEGLHASASLMVIPTPPDLAYIRYVPAPWGHIHVIGADGCNPHPFDTRPEVSESEPVWSPDGSRLAMRVDSPTSQWIDLVDFDGTGLHRLTSTLSADQPSWSPDGTRIAFRAQQPGQREEVYVISTDGTNEQRITFNTSFPWGSSPDAWSQVDHVRWSPAANRIAFDVYRRDDTPRSRGFDIFLVNPDGTGLQRITNGTCYYCATDAVYPEWSPDGSKIAYVSTAGVLYTMSADGSNIQQMSNSSMSLVQSWFFSWSPDGSKLAFNARRFSGGNAIDIVNADGTGQHTIASGDIGQTPAWSKDGTQLYFCRVVIGSGDYSLRRINADGSGEVGFTTGCGVAVRP